MRQTTIKQQWNLDCCLNKLGLEIFINKDANIVWW